MPWILLPPSGGIRGGEEEVECGILILFSRIVSTTQHSSSMHTILKHACSGKSEHSVRCPHCATTLIVRHGTYQRAHPHEQELINVQRYRCKAPDCPWKTFSILSYPFLPIVRHFQQTVFFFHSLYNVERKTQADTARQLGVTRGVIKRLARFCHRFVPWFTQEKHIGVWGPHPEVSPEHFWIDYTRDFSQALYPMRWKMS